MNDIDPDVNGRDVVFASLVENMRGWGKIFDRKAVETAVQAIISQRVNDSVPMMKRLRPHRYGVTVALDYLLKPE